MHARTAPHAIPCLHGHPQLHSCVPSLPSAVTIKRNLESILEATTRSRQHSFAPSPTASSRPRLSSRADPRLHVQARRIERHQVRRCVWRVQATSAGVRVAANSSCKRRAQEMRQVTRPAPRRVTRLASPAARGAVVLLCANGGSFLCAALRRSRAPGLRRATAHAAANV